MPMAAPHEAPADPAAAVPARRKAGERLSPDMTVGDGVEAVLVAALQTLRGAARGDAWHPQTIHHFRVGIRRLRSPLSTFRALWPDPDRRALSADLAVLAKRYGKAREWDVLIAGVLDPLARTRPDDSLIGEIATEAASARRRAMPSDASPGTDAEAVTERLAAAEFLHRPAPGRETLWQQPLGDFTMSFLHRHHRRLRKRLKRIDLADQPGFHQVRIEAKKIRYCLEIMSDLYDRKALNAYLDRIVRVQNVLGQLNDALVAPRLVAELPLSARGEGLMQGWLAREALAARERFPKAARRLRHARPFWEP
jgi:triphosphatase